MANVVESVPNIKKARLRDIVANKAVNKTFSTLSRVQKDALLLMLLHEAGYDID